MISWHCSYINQSASRSDLSLTLSGGGWRICIRHWFMQCGVMHFGASSLQCLHSKFHIFLWPWYLRHNLIFLIIQLIWWLLRFPSTSAADRAKKTGMRLALMCDLHLWSWQIRGQLLDVISMSNNCYLAIFSRLILLLSCQYRLHNAHVPSRWRPTYRDRIQDGP